MRCVALLAVLTFGTGSTLGAAAQAPVSASALLLAQPGSQNCPVNLSARRVPGGGLSEVSNARVAHGPALHLTFLPVGFFTEPRTSTEPRAVVQAEVLLHGTTGDGVLPASAGTVSYATEEFTVRPSAGTNSSFHSVLYLKKLSAVDFVELTTIIFADGSKWHTSADSTCRVAPVSLRLVASGK